MHLNFSVKKLRKLIVSIGNFTTFAKNNSQEQ